MNMDKIFPLISVVMSVYNTEKYVAEAIESILNQTLTNLEFIIVDDGSTDNSLEIFQSYIKIDNRVKVIVNPENIGLAKSLNRGISIARGKYIARMDADDISLPRRLIKQLDFLESNPEIDVVGSNYTRIDTHSNVLTTTDKPTSPALIWWNLYFGNPIAHPTVMMRRSLFLDGKIRYDEQIPVAQDYHLWHQVIEDHSISNIPESLLLYRVHPESVTSKNLKEPLNTGFITVRNHVQKYVKFPLSENLGYALLRDLTSIDNIYDARGISKAIKCLYKQVQQRYPDMSADDKLLIKRSCSHKLLKIWDSQNKNFMLFPLFLYAFSLYPRLAIKNFIKSKRA